MKSRRSLCDQQSHLLACALDQTRRWQVNGFANKSNECQECKILQTQSRLPSPTFSAFYHFNLGFYRLENLVKISLSSQVSPVLLKGHTKLRQWPSSLLIWVFQAQDAFGISLSRKPLFGQTHIYHQSRPLVPLSWQTINLVDWKLPTCSFASEAFA